MTDQELKAWTREQIAKKLTAVYKWAARCERDGYYDPDEAQEALLGDTDEILALKKPDGTRLLGIVSDEQELPVPPFCSCEAEYNQSQVDMLNAGFVRLVKDE